MRAFITGISGQDGSYLAEYLYSLGFEVHGLVRIYSEEENQHLRIKEMVRDGKVIIHRGDLTDYGFLIKTLEEIRPDHIYNLAAQSHVGQSFDIPHFTVQVNAMGALNLLEAFRQTCPEARYYQAGTSEMFGNNFENEIKTDRYQNENTIMKPVSPYGCAKLFAHNIGVNYRNAYGLFIANGILFNHESPRRGSKFVTNKVVKAAVRIKLGLQDKLELGNMDSYRDWGHSKDYVRAMYLMLNSDKADDYVVSTGKTHCVRDLCQYVFGRLGMDYRDYVVQNPKFMRPEELDYLRGDCTKIKEELGWEPEYTFETMLDEMIDHWAQIDGLMI